MAGTKLSETHPSPVRMAGLEARLADSEAEIAAAQALRYRVFYDEMGAIPSDLPTRSKDDDRDGPADAKRDSRSRAHSGLWEEEPEERRPTFPEMLKIAFDDKLPTPEEILIQPKWVAGGAFEMGCDFYKYVKSRNLSAMNRPS